MAEMTPERGRAGERTVGMSKKNSYSRVMWGGFVCDRLSQEIVDDQWGGEQHIRPVPALFYTRREARKQYQDVRKVLVMEAPHA